MYLKYAMIHLTPVNKSTYAILEQDYSIVAISPRIVQFKSHQSLQLVETGTIVIATIEKLAPGLDFVFVSWKEKHTPTRFYRGVYSVAPSKGGTESSLKVGQRILLQVIQPATFGKQSILCDQICLVTNRIVAWPGHQYKSLESSLPELPTVKRGSPKLRGFTRAIARTSSSATGPARWSREQYKMETDWEKTSLEFAKIKISLSAPPLHRNLSQPVWASWFSRPVSPSVIVEDSRRREYVARWMIAHYPNVARNFDIGNHQAWANWYSLHSAALTQPKIPLPCGGTLIIESTQSGWCIDVNSGTSLDIGSKERANQEAIYGFIHQASVRSMHGSLMLDLIQETKLDWMESILQTFCYLIQHDPYHTRVVSVSHDGFLRVIRNRIPQYV